MTVTRMKLAEAAPGPSAAFAAVDRSLREGPLDPVVRELVKIRASQLNGCVYCLDLHAAEARRNGEGEDRLLQLAVWPESELFTEAERAALAYTDQATRLVDGVDDPTWEALAEHFTPEEIGALVAQVALINAYNRIGVPTRRRPGD